MVECHKCGHNNEEEHEFCEECGSKLKEALKCKKCGNELQPGNEFCEECGTKTKEIKATHHEHKYESKLAKYKWLLIIAGIVLLIGIVFVFAVPLPYEAKEGFTEKVPYDAQETYTEKEPYTSTVQGTTQEAYTENQCNRVNYKYTKTREVFFGDSVSGGLCTAEKKGSNNAQCVIIKNIYIRNLETVAGEFFAICSYSNGQQYKTLITRIEPLSEDSVQCSTSYNLGETLYLSSTEIEPPYRQDCGTVTKYTNVPTSQEVTLYRDVQKTRTVTKYKDDYKERFITKYATLFQQWSGQVKYYYKV